MKQIILYIVRGAVYRRSGNADDIVRLYKEFREENLIIAREQAFRYYQNYIDVFLESKGTKYYSHEQAEEDLEDFINSHQKRYTLSGELITNSEIGIEISFVYDDTIIQTFKNGTKIYKGEEPIHGINKNNKEIKDLYFKNLRMECDIYDENNYDMKYYREAYNIATLFEEEESAYILKTGIDFDSLLEDKYLY